jgi:hypothetical protein
MYLLSGGRVGCGSFGVINSSLSHGYSISVNLRLSRYTLTLPPIKFI